MTSTICFPRGNLAPEGSVIKSTAIDPRVVDADGVYRKTGPARVFVRETDAIAAIKGQGDRPLKPGDVLVLIGRGPLGSGMEEIYQITSALQYLSWGHEVAVVTDARFSGVSTGACIGLVGPEALAGGPIGKRPRRRPDSHRHRPQSARRERRSGGRRAGRIRSGGRRMSAGTPRAPSRSVARSAVARRDAALGRTAATRRRHLGRLRVRRRADRREAAGRVTGRCSLFIGL